MLNSLDYYKLQSRLIKKAKRKIFPLKVLFELTYRCNLKCRHCYIKPPDLRMNITGGGRPRELTKEEVFIILDQVAETGCFTIGFTGGEPFLRRDIFEILEYAKRKGFNIIMLTNGTLITAKKADRLKELNLNKLDISFHSTREETFDWFTQVAGTYKSVLKTVKLLRDRKLEVYLKTTAMTINKDDIVEMRHLAVAELGAHFRCAMEVTPAWDGQKNNLRFRLSAEEINQVQKQIEQDTEIEVEKLAILGKKKSRVSPRKRPDIKINHNRLFHCGAGKTEGVINPYGEMRLCMDIPCPNYKILSGSFAEGWATLSDYVKKTPPGATYQCRDCELIRYCDFCPAKGWLECADTSACPPYFKQMAQLEKKEAENVK